MLQVELSKGLLSVLNSLEPGAAPKLQVMRLAEQELRRRLARYQLDVVAARHGCRPHR